MDEIIDAEAKSYNEKTNTVSKNFNAKKKKKKKSLQNKKIYIFYLLLVFTVI